MGPRTDWSRGGAHLACDTKPQNMYFKVRSDVAQRDVHDNRGTGKVTSTKTRVSANQKFTNPVLTQCFGSGPGFGVVGWSFVNGYADCSAIGGGHVNMPLGQGWAFGFGFWGWSFVNVTRCGPEPTTVQRAVDT